jgi:uncharacterized protein (TIGR02118 family)
MIKLTILYSTPDDSAAFDSYYFETHIPLANDLPGLIGCEVSKPGPTFDGSPTPYYLQTELYYEDNDALIASFTSPQGAITAADVANFSPVPPTMFTAEVLKQA